MTPAERLREVNRVIQDSIMAAPEEEREAMAYLFMRQSALSLAFYRGPPKACETIYRMADEMATAGGGT